MGTPRERTEDEVRDLFLQQVRKYVNYWLEEKRTPDVKGKLEGLAFSMLVLLDGGTGLPGFIVAPSPHKDDKEFCRKSGENWWPQNHLSSVNCDIAGGLHEKFVTTG